MPRRADPLDRLSVGAMADLLGATWALDCAGQLAPDPVLIEAVARFLDARPVLLEVVWDRWTGTLEQARQDEARYWLDAELLGNIAPPVSR